jgi:hypothetical protein
MSLKRGDIAALTKIKAVFELMPLTTTSAHTDDVPSDAVACSCMAMNTIQTFFASVENKRNESGYNIFCWPEITHVVITADVDVSKRLAATPFHRTDIATDTYKFVVNTGPLFRDLPDPGKTPIQAMSMDDLKSSSTCPMCLRAQGMVIQTLYQNPRSCPAPPKCSRRRLTRTLWRTPPTRKSKVHPHIVAKNSTPRLLINAYLCRCTSCTNDCRYAGP